MRVPSRSTRRWVLLAAVIGAGGYLGGLLTPSVVGITTVSYTALKADAGGVVTYDRLRADNGYVTVGVMGDRLVNLIAKDGSVVHGWSLTHALNSMATMGSDGSLLYLGDDPSVTGPLGFPAYFGAGATLERVAWHGGVTWSFTYPGITHDFTELPDGTIAALALSKVPADVASRIGGGIPGTEASSGMWGDQILEIDPATNHYRVVFDVAKAWTPEDHPLPAFMPRSEWTHANSIAYTPSDPITHQEAYLISFRAVSTVMLVSRATGKVIWSYGGLWVLDQQHDATLLPNGHVLLFDDGQYLRGGVSASQILEIDPLANQVVSSYSGYGIVGSAFYSAITGGAQRLPNGDTLVTLGTKGQLMEITPDGSVVWDYRATSDMPDPKYPAVSMNFLFKSRGYPASEVGPLLTKG